MHIYGASTKGNTILQWCDINTMLVEYAAERNPDKYGAYTLGTNIPIISEAESRAMNPDYYLVLPWHFKEEFIEREKCLAYIDRRRTPMVKRVTVMSRDEFIKKTHLKGWRNIYIWAEKKWIIAFAYQVPMQNIDAMITGGPDWLDSVGLEIEAKAEAPRSAPPQPTPAAQTAPEDAAPTFATPSPTQAQPLQSMASDLPK